MKFPSYTILQAEGLTKYPNITRSMFASRSTDELKQSLSTIAYLIDSNDDLVWYEYNRFLDYPTDKAKEEYDKLRDSFHQINLRCAACQWHIKQILEEREAVIY